MEGKEWTVAPGSTHSRDGHCFMANLEGHVCRLLGRSPQTAVGDKQYLQQFVGIERITICLSQISSFLEFPL